MVNLSEFEKMFYTDKELREIYEADAELARQEAEQEKRDSEYEALPLQKYNRLAEQYRLFEKEDFDTLAFLNEEIALLVKIREQCIDHETIPSWCEFHIRIKQAEIEETIGDIEYDRRQAQAA